MAAMKAHYETFARYNTWANRRLYDAAAKLSDADYASLKASYTERALAELRTEPAAGPDPVEALVLGFRAQRRTCAEHGARPESDAAYCSECGRYLAGACPTCGAAITEPAARFCAGCGNALAA